jgi:hypothetical protein
LGAGGRELPPKPLGQAQQNQSRAQQKPNPTQQNQNRTATKTKSGATKSKFFFFPEIPFYQSVMADSGGQEPDVVRSEALRPS